MGKIIYMEGDLSGKEKFGDSIAIDTEATGLSMLRDRLCVVQLTDGAGTTYVVKVDPPYNCPNLKKLLSDSKRGKVFHFARFDLAMIRKCLGISMTNIFCTKIASRLARTSTERHSLAAIVEEFFGIKLDKFQQTGDWATPKLSEEQIAYAASDVEYLHRIRDIMIEKLKREKRLTLAKECFAFLPHRAELDLTGWEDEDIFAHH